MKPQFKDSQAWHQAELLMQPSLIRVIDNIRKQLETSPWQGSYEEVQTPFPGYVLCVKKGDEERRFDIWEMCFEVCFQNYAPTHAPTEPREVEIDTSLLDEDGEVDWNRLDDKARQLVEEIFAQLGGG